MRPPGILESGNGVPRHRPLGVLVASPLQAALAGCGSSRAREKRRSDRGSNVRPDHYRADLPAALRTYVSDPTNIRDAYVSEPEVKPIGPQKRYVSCLRFNAKNGEGRYVGDRELLAVFVSGRFDQLVELQPKPANPVESGDRNEGTVRSGRLQAFPGAGGHEPVTGDRSGSTLRRDSPQRRSDPPLWC